MGTSHERVCVNANKKPTMYVFTNNIPCRGSPLVTVRDVRRNRIGVCTSIVGTEAVLITVINKKLKEEADSGSGPEQKL